MFNYLSTTEFYNIYIRNSDAADWREFWGGPSTLKKCERLAYSSLGGKKNGVLLRWQNIRCISFICACTRQTIYNSPFLLYRCSQNKDSLCQGKLNLQGFLMYNITLEKRHMKRDPICQDEIDSDDEWIIEIPSLMVSIKEPICLDEIDSEDKLITQKENVIFPNQGRWSEVLNEKLKVV